MFKKLMRGETEVEPKKENRQPVDKEKLEKLVKLVETAYETGCSFELTLELSIGEFFIDSLSYNGIKIINSKKDGDKLLIKQKNMLLSSDNYIELENIIHATFVLKYCDKDMIDIDE